MMGRSLLVGALSVVVLIVMAVPVAAKVDRNVFVSDIPVDMTVTLCGGGEDVHITGTEHSEYNVFVTKSGGEHINSKSSWDVTAVGVSSGDDYKASYSLHHVANGKAPLAPPTSQVLTTRVTMRVGAGPEALVTTSHTTRILNFDASEAKVVNVTMTSSC